MQWLYFFFVCGVIKREKLKMMNIYYLHPNDIDRLVTGVLTFSLYIYIIFMVMINQKA